MLIFQDGGLPVSGLLASLSQKNWKSTCRPNFDDISQSTAELWRQFRL